LIQVKPASSAGIVFSAIGLFFFACDRVVALRAESDGRREVAVVVHVGDLI
jgi:hypothetical protein